MSNQREQLLQDVQAFSVQIRHAVTDEPIGTGIVVSQGGMIVTCAHVVRDALGVEARDAIGSEIGLYFPKNTRLGRAAQSRRAKVTACFPYHDDDVVLLQVVGDPPPIDQPAILDSARESSRHDFQSFGYHRLDDYLGLPAYGRILGFADQPESRKLHSEPLVLRSGEIDSGMSGAAVLDVERNRVVEVVQHQEGDQHGQFTNTDLREFLQLCAEKGHESFCLITSRAPLLDLLRYPAYKEYAVERLSSEDGRALLRNLGIRGKDELLDAVVHEWGGHALTLTLLATYLLERWGGDMAHIGDVPSPTSKEPHYEGVRRVLRRYDQHLTEAERAFLTIFSAFRIPVMSSAFDPVFRTAITPDALTTPIATLDNSLFAAMLKRLERYKILQYNPEADRYTTHPLIRSHYLDALNSRNRVEIKVLHGQIKDYYLTQVADLPQVPTLSNLFPLIEAVHHACRAEAYDEAYELQTKRVDQGDRWVMTSQLGAYDTELTIMRDFFPGGDTTQDPLVSKPSAKVYILNQVGYFIPCQSQNGQAYPERQGCATQAAGASHWSREHHQRLATSA